MERSKEDIYALERRSEVQLRAAAAMAAIEEAAELIVEARKKKIPYARVDNPSMTIRSILIDLFDGCWESGFSSGQDTPPRQRDVT